MRNNLLDDAKYGIRNEILGTSVGHKKLSKEIYSTPEEALQYYKEIEPELDGNGNCIGYRGAYYMELSPGGEEMWPDPGSFTSEGRDMYNVDLTGRIGRFVGKIITDEIMIDLARQAGVPGAFKKLKPSEKLQKRREARLAGKPLKSTNHRNKKKSASSQHGKGATPTSSRSGGHGSSTKTATTAGRTTPARPATHTSTAGRTASAGHTARPTASKTAATSTKKAKPAKSSSSKKKSTGLGFGKKRR